MAQNHFKGFNPLNRFMNQDDKNEVNYDETLKILLAYGADPSLKSQVKNSEAPIFDIIKRSNTYLKIFEKYA